LQTTLSPAGVPAALDVTDISRACPACGRTTGHLLRFKTNGCGILQCRSCGLGRTESSGFDPAAYYTEDYFSGGHADGYADYLGAEPVLRREFAHSVDFIRRYRNAGRLLELGCAYGFFLQEAARYFEVAGIELASEAAEHGRRAGLNILSGSASAESLRQIGHVDVIVLFDVIEHLPEPIETLDLCRQHLNPGGIIVITTGRFRLRGRKASRSKVAIDDATAASLVLHAGERAPDVRSARAVDDPRRSSLEDRSHVTDRLPAAAHARTAFRGHRGIQPHRLTGQPVRCDAHRSAKTTVMNDGYAPGGTFFRPADFR
jgi:SAM-dependent methyltransferase